MNFGGYGKKKKGLWRVTNLQFVFVAIPTAYAAWVFWEPILREFNIWIYLVMIAYVPLIFVRVATSDFFVKVAVRGFRMKDDWFKNE